MDTIPVMMVIAQAEPPVRPDGTMRLTVLKSRKTKPGQAFVFDPEKGFDFGPPLGCCEVTEETEER